MAAADARCAPLPPSLVAPGQPVVWTNPAGAGFAGVRFDVQAVGLQLGGALLGGLTNVDRNRLRPD